MDRNQHIKDYLTYYVGFGKPPHFAVLLNGPWGIGKTFLVDEFMKRLNRSELRYVRVSLYGLTSFDEIDDALFRAMYPLLDNKGVRIVGNLAKMVGKHFGWSSDAGVKDVLNKANSDIFIFDDLERCAIPVVRVLGYINEFVEHEERKVIIIANEQEIDGGADYTRVREKVIGKTFEIQSVLEDALSAFIMSIRDEKAKEFLESKLSLISELYNQSELHNLRILQQTMWDFERLYVSLNDKHRSHDAALTELLQLLFALSFDLKAGRLEVSELTRRRSALISSLMRGRRDGGSPSSLELAQQRYPQTNIGTTILSDETIVNMLLKGIIDATKIQAELDASSYFVTVADEPAWRTVWYAFERTEVEFDNALAKMERAFQAREYTVSGEILHVFGLRLWLSRIGAIDRTPDQVVVEGKSYLDDLYAQETIEPLSPLDNFTEARFEGYEGLGIHQSKTSEYGELFAYLRTKRQAAYTDKYPHIAHDLMKHMTTDLPRFVRLVTVTHDGGNDFYNLPVLASADPETFVVGFLGLQPAQQRTVLIALRGRYEHGRINRELAQERSWLERVRALLDAAADSMSPMSKYRLRQNVKYGLDEVLGLTKEDARQPEGVIVDPDVIADE